MIRRAMHESLWPDMVKVLDCAGTLVFALSGGLLGVKKQFDLFGVLFLSFVVSVTGGIMRDVLIGAVPPAAIIEIHYAAIAIGGGLVTFFWAARVARYHRLIVLLDAVGLGLFAVLGTEKAIAHHIHPVMASILGMLTGIGGGMTRDVLAGDIPFVLRSDLYAVAALAAGAIVSLGHAFDLPSISAMLAGAAACIFLRMMAIYRGWRAPVARHPVATE
jgi:uncharacterized membrane protein YeiH